MLRKNDIRCKEVESSLERNEEQPCMAAWGKEWTRPRDCDHCAG